ncbi:MAG: 2-isopropylmalate synthase [Candidatus Jettenia sp.]|uniref:2-isopropylmalate synthase n=1 Tax=Candidatus Jettenia caeni TaxID=247490 RepID=I3IQI1_9BACT|nr:2-isopropylmalate synthase [Candidatus Jettenia sp. AMX1]MBC6928603.1 2-isopropylmalate synthase [Candidatus Jettenia sp.]NUN22896.1 2-isopropylmalate synthase [Candidatus Jettenia caeni]KAA0249860.1 MAG: 2-isopropylmalate synthase [Candidatus Jettenia sp. AMX1]MCE7880612.1 2-isopropylmalate synthase [Candidatus Jettenia sp. AMX1]MCQ3927236.1 2-isopropylmalate synthase [Candidatus Jettenia sp.]
MANNIIIFDTTLRDGEQSPGASLDINEKVQIARQLALLQVNVIEAGFPVSSQGDFESVKRIAQDVRGVSVAGLARAVEKDIDSAARALEKAEKPRIHIFLATSEIHRKYKLLKAKEEIIHLAVKAVKYARKYVDDIEFSPEDASRTELDFLVQVVEAVIDAGAKTVNIPDTVGYAVPDHYASLIRGLKEHVKNIHKAIISVHCHNDLGLAVANSLAAVKAGAQQVECTINGIGERAGNAALEEIVMALKTRQDFYHCSTRIVTKELIATSKLVSTLTGLRVQRNKAIVGENAFAHQSGVHQDGVLKERTTYEIIKPEDVGHLKTRLVLGKLSGRHALKERIKELGYELSEEEFERAFKEFKHIADKKKEVFDEDIEAIIGIEKMEVPAIFQLEGLSISCGPNTVPTAGVRLKLQDGSTVDNATIGDGPIDALFKAIDLSTGIPGKLQDYNIQAVTSGKDAMGEVYVNIDVNGKSIAGRAVSTDIIEASAKAYLHAINKAAANNPKYTIHP